MAPLARREIQGLSDDSGEQPGPGERFLKLNATEAPFAPSPQVMAAIRDLEPERLRAYPSPCADSFRDAAAAHHGLAPGNILAGNATDDLLDILVGAFVSPGGRIASPWPSYPRLEAICAIHGASLQKAAWLEASALPAAQLLALRPDLVYIANPNAPSGTAVAVDAIGDLASRFDGILVVDEAYADFAETNCVPLLAQHENLVITRTLSKGYALAGLRFAYALGHEDVMAQMKKVKHRYNTGAVAQAAAIAAIADQEHAQRLWQHVRSERGRLILELQILGFDVPPSQASFVFARHPDMAAETLYEGLKKQGVLVYRWQGTQPSEEAAEPAALRITVGTSQENNALLGALESLLGRGGGASDAQEPPAA